MANQFVLTAQIALQAPTNARQTLNQIQRQLQGVNVSVNLNSNPAQIKSLNQQLNSVNQSARSASNSVSELGKTIGAAARRFGAISLATGTFLGLTRAIKGSISDAIEFERQMIILSQTTEKSVNQLGDLYREVTRLSTGLGVSSDGLIKTSIVLAQAGLEARKAKGALEVLAKTQLAASFDDIQSTTEGAIAILAQFRREAIGAGGDIKFLETSLEAINQVSKKYAVESSDLIAVIRRSGGAFEAAGGSLNELLALFTSVRATTRESAETISTGLRTIFTRIQRADTIAQLKELGITLQDLEGKFVGPFEAIKRISEGLSSLDPRDIRFAQIVEELGGFRQIGKVIPLIKQFTLAQEALNTAQGASGSLSRDAETAQLSLANKIVKVKEEFQALVREFTQGEGFQSVARGALEFARALIRIADAIEPILPLIASLGAIQVGRGLASALGAFSGFTRKNSGGRIMAFASGGMVPGTGNRDTVPAMLSPGEFVIRKSSVKKIGAENLQKLNSGGTVKTSEFSSGSLDSSTQGAISLRKKIVGYKNWQPKDDLYIKYNVEEIDPLATKDESLKQEYIKNKVIGNGRLAGEAFEKIVGKRVGKTPTPSNDFLDFPYGEAKSDKNWGNPLNEKKYKSLLAKAFNTFNSYTSRFTPSYDKLAPTDRPINLYIDKLRRASEKKKLRENYPKYLEKLNKGGSVRSKKNKAFVFDFDDTLGETEAAVGGGANPYQNFRGAAAAKFVDEGHGTRYAAMAKKRFEKGFDIHVLTARPQEQETVDAIQRFMQKFVGGPAKSVIGVADMFKGEREPGKRPGTTRQLSTASKKAKVLRQFASQYEQIVFADDNMENYLAGKELEKEGLRVKSVLAKKAFGGAISKHWFGGEADANVRYSFTRPDKKGNQKFDIEKAEKMREKMLKGLPSGIADRVRGASMSMGQLEKGTRGQYSALKNAITFDTESASLYTAKHEVAHAIDRAKMFHDLEEKRGSFDAGTFSGMMEELEQSNKFSSTRHGFANIIATLLKRSYIKARMPVSDYRESEKELFADALSKVPSKVRAILVNSSNQAIGAKALMDYWAKKPGPIPGLANISPDEIRPYLPMDRKAFGGIAKKFATGGIVNEKDVGALILEPSDKVSNAKTVVSNADIEEKAKKKQINTKIFENNRKHYGILRSGVKDSRFLETLNEGIDKGLSSAIGAASTEMSSLLDMPSIKTDSSETKTLSKLINPGAKATLFEEILANIGRKSGGSFSSRDNPAAPFDFVGDIGEANKQIFENTQSRWKDLKYQDAKLSSRSAQPKEFKKKIANQIVSEADLTASAVREMDEKFKALKDRTFRSKEHLRGELVKLGLTTKTSVVGNGLDEWLVKNNLHPEIEQGFQGKNKTFRYKFANGGAAPSDTVPALLTPGEFVVKKSTAQKIGYGALDRMNKTGEVQGFAKGGAVNVQSFRFGGKAAKENIRDSVDRESYSIVGSLEKAGDIFAGFVSDLPQFLQGAMRNVKLRSIGKNDKFNTNAGVRTGDQIRGVSLGGEVGINTARATEHTVRHEASHEADLALGGGKIHASAQEGTFQNKVAKELIKTYEKELDLSEYRLKHQEVFGDALAKVPPEVRRILLSTTDAAEGSKKLAEYFEKAGKPIQGLADLSADEFGGKQGSKKGFFQRFFSGRAKAQQTEQQATSTQTTSSPQPPPNTYQIGMSPTVAAKQAQAKQFSAFGPYVGGSGGSGGSGSGSGTSGSSGSGGGSQNTSGANNQQEAQTESALRRVLQSAQNFVFLSASAGTLATQFSSFDDATKQAITETTAFATTLVGLAGTVGDFALSLANAIPSGLFKKGAATAATGAATNLATSAATGAVTAGTAAGGTAAAGAAAGGTAAAGGGISGVMASIAGALGAFLIPIALATAALAGFGIYIYYMQAKAKAVAEGLNKQAASIAESIEQGKGGSTEKYVTLQVQAAQTLTNSYLTLAGGLDSIGVTSKKARQAEIDAVRNSASSFIGLVKTIADTDKALAEIAADKGLTAQQKISKSVQAIQTGDITNRKAGVNLEELLTRTKVGKTAASVTESDFKLETDKMAFKNIQAEFTKFYEEAQKRKSQLANLVQDSFEEAMSKTDYNKIATSDLNFDGVVNGFDSIIEQNKEFETSYRNARDQILKINQEEVNQLKAQGKIFEATMKESEGQKQVSNLEDSMKRQVEANQKATASTLALEKAMASAYATGVATRKTTDYIYSLGEASKSFETDLSGISSRISGELFNVKIPEIPDMKNLPAFSEAIKKLGDSLGPQGQEMAAQVTGVAALMEKAKIELSNINFAQISGTVEGGTKAAMEKAFGGGELEKLFGPQLGPEISAALSSEIQNAIELGSEGKGRITNTEFEKIADVLEPFVGDTKQFFTQYNALLAQNVQTYQAYSAALAAQLKAAADGQQKLVDISNRGAERMEEARGRSGFVTAETKINRRTQSSEARLGTVGFGGMAGNVGALSQNLKNLNKEIKNNQEKIKANLSDTSLQDKDRELTNKANELKIALEKLADQSENASDVMSDIAKERGKRDFAKDTMKSLITGNAEERMGVMRQFAGVQQAMAQGTFQMMPDEDKKSSFALLERLAELDTTGGYKAVLDQLIANDATMMGISPNIVQATLTSTTAEQALLKRLTEINEQEKAAQEALNGIIDKNQQDLNKELNKLSGAITNLPQDIANKLKEEKDAATKKQADDKAAAGQAERDRKRQEEITAPRIAAEEKLKKLQEQEASAKKTMEASRAQASFTSERASSAQPGLFDVSLDGGKAKLAQYNALTQQAQTDANALSIATEKWIELKNKQKLVQQELNLLLEKENQLKAATPATPAAPAAPATPATPTASATSSTTLLQELGAQTIVGGSSYTPLSQEDATKITEAARSLSLAKGGVVYAANGALMKPKGTDTVPAMLTPGEFVMRKSSVDKYGTDMMQAINSGQYLASKINLKEIEASMGSGQYLASSQKINPKEIEAFMGQKKQAGNVINSKNFIKGIPTRRGSPEQVRERQKQLRQQAMGFGGAAYNDPVNNILGSLMSPPQQQRASMGPLSPQEQVRQNQLRIQAQQRGMPMQNVYNPIGSAQGGQDAAMNGFKDFGQQITEAAKMLSGMTMNHTVTVDGMLNVNSAEVAQAVKDSVGSFVVEKIKEILKQPSPFTANGSTPKK